MGKYFRMSTHFDKRSPQSFGLIPFNCDIAIDPNDNSMWRNAKLYDYGWGEENGYYRLPILNFSQLMDIVIYENNNEDKFGAAALILRLYPEQLLQYCEAIAKDNTKLQDFRELIRIFNLKTPLNRCNAEGKSYHLVQAEYMRWKKIADFAANVCKV